jgi:hypothetical protein
MAIVYNNPNALPQGYSTGAGTLNGVGSYEQHSLLSSIDALPPDVSTKLYRRFGGQGLDILNLLIAQGAKRVVNNSNGSFHFEEDRYNQAITVSNNPASGTTGISIQTTTGDLDKPFVVVGDLLIRMSDFVRLRVTDVTPEVGTNGYYTITANSISGSAVNIEQGDILAIYSSAFGEDTAQPDAKATYWSRFYAPMQRHKTSAKITGDALTDKVFPVMMDDGKTLKGFHSHLFAQHEYRHLLGLVGAMILGKAYTPSAFLTSGDIMHPDGYNTSTYAQGMVDTFEQRAVTTPWDIAGTGNEDFSIQALYDLIAGMKANWTGNDLMGLFCKELYQAFEVGTLDYTQNVNIASTRQESAKVIFGENTDYETMMSTFAFSTLTLNGKNLSVKSFDLSYDPTLFGSGTNNVNKFTGMGFVMPAEKQADASGLMRNAVELTYKSMDGEDRFMKVWDDGAASPRRLGPNDNYVVYMLTHFGFDWFKIEQCGLLYKD